MAEHGDVGDRGFLKAPKRGRQSRRPLLERPVTTAAPHSPPEDELCTEDVDVETQEDIRSELGVWCRAATSNSGDFSSSEVAPPDVQAIPSTAPPAAAPPKAPAPAAPLWARWPVPGDAARERHLSSEDDAEGVDHWASTPGAYFERICIGFKDAGEEDRGEDEASTCDGEEPEEEASDADDLEAFTDEVVIGYRPDVDTGIGLPDDQSECAEEDEEVCEESTLAEGGVNAEAEETDGTSGEAETWGEITGANAQNGIDGMRAFVAGLLPDLPKVTHILFVVHGMGATADALVQNVKDLTDSLQDMRKYWFWHTNIEVHVEMIDWKSSFSAQQNAIFDRITPAEARDRRMSLNATLSDVIFYKTAHHRSKIHDIVVQKLNVRVRSLRSESSGRFADARVSVVGHSLGSVISYDVLSGFGRDDDTTGLEFEIDNFFLWGSPLAAFVSIADIDHQHGKFTMPDSLKVCNIFHPHDPVAFRIEPLYYHSQEQIPPEMIPHWVNNGIRSNKQWARSYEYAKGLAHQKWEQLKNKFCEAVGASGEADLSRQEWDLYLNEEKDLPASLALPAKSSGSSDAAIQDEETLLKPQMRLDYVLQETTVESYVESYGLLQSHFCYWTSRDVSLLMLKKMSHQDTAELNATEHEQQEKAKAEAAKQAAAKEEAAKDADTAGKEVSTLASASTWSLLPAFAADLDISEAIVQRLGAVANAAPRMLDDGELDPVGPIPMGF